MKKYFKGILIGIGFIALSAILYYSHFLIFKDSHHIFLYLLGDIAFLPIEVLLVSVIFHKVIEDKDKKERLKKVNMVLSVFFSEAGVELIEVQKNQQAWRGAIERAIGSHRLRLLVPHEAMHDALDWVNQRHNRLHVRLLEVSSASKPTSVHPLSRSSRSD